MEGLSREVLEKTGTAVVVATFKTIGDNEPDLYANKLYEKWGIGKKARTKGCSFSLTSSDTHQCFRSIIYVKANKT